MRRLMKMRGRWMLSAAMLSCVAISGCKHDETAAAVEVAVQAAKPEVGPISERVEGDAVLAPLAQAAFGGQDQCAGTEVLCPARSACSRGGSCW